MNGQISRRVLGATLAMAAALAVTACAPTQLAARPATPALTAYSSTTSDLGVTAQRPGVSPASLGGASSSAKAATVPVSRATASSTSAEAPASSSILLYAQDWNSYPGSRTTAAWQEAAVTHQVLVGTPGPVYGDMISQLHAWNPELKVLVYDLGPYTQSGTSEYQTLMAEHPNYFARDAAGNLITVKAASGSPGFAENTLMDEGNPGWQAVEAQRVATNIAKYGFDGAYIDSMGPGVFSGTTTGVPMDPTTGQAYTKAEWMAAGGQALDVIKAAIGSKYLFSTGLVNGVAFTQDTYYLSDSTASAFQTDSWTRVADGSLTQWPSASLLAADLAMVESLNAQGKAFYAWTKVWMTATPAQEAAWETYSLAAYLLVDNGVSDYYTFDTPFNSDRTTIFYPSELASLGAPLGSFTLTAGMYSRSFQNGTVTLNTKTDAASINCTS